MCSFGSCQTRFEFLSQFRKVRNAFECFVTQVQTRLPKTKCVWPMKINVICTVYEKRVVIFVPCYTDICSVIRSCCPDIFVHLGSAYGPPRSPQIWKNYILFSYLGFKLTHFLSNCFLIWHVLGERIAGKQDRPSAIIGDPITPP